VVHACPLGQISHSSGKGPQIPARNTGHGSGLRITSEDSARALITPLFFSSPYITFSSYIFSKRTLIAMNNAYDKDKAGAYCSDIYLEKMVTVRI